MEKKPKRKTRFGSKSSQESIAFAHGILDNGYILFKEEKKNKQENEKKKYDKKSSPAHMSIELKGHYSFFHFVCEKSRNEKGRVNSVAKNCINICIYVHAHI